MPENRYVVKWMSPEGSEYDECDTLQEAKLRVAELEKWRMPKGMVLQVRGIFLIDGCGCQVEAR